ncbi:MAG: YbjN domain-containing protein [Ruminiclostridium sp.]|nr:YbjN domain-containing protein [Ruminiclostridium sp.]
MARKKKTEENGEWEKSLLGSIITLFDDNAQLTAEEIEGKPVIVIEPMEENESFPEDVTVSVERLGGSSQVSLMAAVFTGLPEDRAADILRLLPYINEYVVFGHFDLLRDEGALFFSYSFIMNGTWPMESFLRVFTQTFDEVTFTAADRREMLLPLIRGETTADKMIEDDNF